jgi:ABC-type proline/glycine betaine transport system ATPase subunit
VADVSFDVAAGEVFGFLGLNGAEASTTIRLLLGLYRATSGLVLRRDQRAAVAELHRHARPVLPGIRRLRGKLPAAGFPQPGQTHVPHRCDRPLITGLNVAGASTVARAERVVVAIKLVILVLFVAVGMAGVSAARLAPSQWTSAVSV